MASGKVLDLRFDDDGFAVIQMVDRENRFRMSVIDEWNATLDKVLGNPDTKALVITGSGKFFSNGIDLEWISSAGVDGTRKFINGLTGLFSRLMIFPIPTVAALNGHAFGGGAFLALACDFRVMRSDRGWLCWPETAIGMRFGDPLLKLAKAKIPPGEVQRDALIYAKRFTGTDAKSYGLCDVTVEESELVNAGKKLAMAALGPRGLNRSLVEETKKDIYGQFLSLSKL